MKAKRPLRGDSGKAVDGNGNGSELVEPRFCAATCGQRGCRALADSREPGKRAAPSAAPPPAAGLAAGRRPGTVGLAVVDGDEAVRRIVSQLLAGGAEFRGCGFFRSAAELRHAWDGLDVQLVLMELRLPDQCGIDFARHLRSRRPALQVIIASTLRDSELIQRAAAVGASHWLVKPLRLSQCLATLRFAASGFNPTPIGCRKPTRMNRHGGWRGEVHPRARLTPREEAVLACLAQGLQYAEVEDRLGLTHAGLKKIAYRVYHRVGASNRTEAINRYWPAGRAADEDS